MNEPGIGQRDGAADNNGGSAKSIRNKHADGSLSCARGKHRSGRIVRRQALAALGPGFAADRFERLRRVYRGMGAAC